MSSIGKVHSQRLHIYNQGWQIWSNMACNDIFAKYTVTVSLPGHCQCHCQQMMDKAFSIYTIVQHRPTHRVSLCMLVGPQMSHKVDLQIYHQLISYGSTILHAPWQCRSKTEKYQKLLFLRTKICKLLKQSTKINDKLNWLQYTLILLWLQCEICDMESLMSFITKIRDIEQKFQDLIPIFCYILFCNFLIKY